MNITTLTPQQLRNAADLKERIDALRDELNELLGGEVPAFARAGIGAGQAPDRPKNGRRKKRKKVSAEGRANISAAAKARWAARKMGKRSAKAPAEPEQPVETPKRKRSAAWSKALSEAMKKRWARARRAGKSRL
jgi:hypothetical protein